MIIYIREKFTINNMVGKKKKNILKQLTISIQPNFHATQGLAIQY